MEFSTSPWNIKTKAKESFAYSQKQPEIALEKTTFPSLFLDALGGGKPKSPYSRKNSPQPLENSNVDEDDRPPVTSIFSMNPLQNSSSFSPALNISSSFQSTPVSNTMVVDEIMNSSVATTPLKNATSVTLFGFPPYKWNQVLDLAKSVDKVVSFRKSDDENGNWMVVTFASRQGVLAIKDYDGKMIDNSWILSVKMGELFSAGKIETTSTLKPTPLKLTPKFSSNVESQKKNPVKSHVKELNQESIFTKSLDPTDVSYEENFIRPSYWHKVVDLIFSW